MANPNPIPKAPKHGKELVQRARAGILNAFDAVEKRGLVISEILADTFIADPLKFMDTAAKYIPKGSDVATQHITNAIQLTDAQLLEIIKSRQLPEKDIGGQVIEHETGNNGQELTNTVINDAETGHY